MPRKFKSTLTNPTIIILNTVLAGQTKTEKLMYPFSCFQNDVSEKINS